MQVLVARLVAAVALFVGGGPLLLFGYFLVFGPPRPLELPGTSSGRLLIDALLCLFFFAQHSVMIRRWFKCRLDRLIPAHYGPAVYAIASGVALIVVVLLWQPVGEAFYRPEGGVRWLLGAVWLLATAWFAWAVEALGAFDPFGVHAIAHHLRGKPASSAPLAVRGPYRLVRHPLYTAMLVLIWSSGRISYDMILFNVLWTAWLIAGASLEERDLVTEFGEPYRRYQRAVPMLLPWRRPLTTD